MIPLYALGIWWLVDHGVNWHAFVGSILCITLLMWWVIEDGRGRAWILPGG